MYRRVLAGVVGLAFGLMLVLMAYAQQSSAPPGKASDLTYAKDIAPILSANCLICHSDLGGTQGDLDMTTYESLMKGGKDGPVIVPGRSAESLLILMVQGKRQPKMPLKGELKPEHIATLQAWIDAGAHAPAPGTAAMPSPTADLLLKVPDIKQLAPVLPQVSSVAFRPDARVLAAAGYKQVQLIDPSGGKVIGSLKGPVDVVRSVAYSPDGKRLAAAGGAPARFGEVCLWDTSNGSLIHTLKGHKDYIYSVAFSPDGKLLATASYDKLIKLWDAQTGAEVRTLKDHTDAVYPVVFSPDGKWLASGSADRTVKIWEVASGRRLYTLSDATDVIFSLAFHPSGKELSAASADKTIRTYTLTDRDGTLIQSIIAHDDTINKIAYTTDGRLLVSTGADRAVKFWDLKTGLEVKALEKQPDWVLDLAFSPDGRWLAVGRYDGSVAMYDTKSGQRVQTPIRAPEPVRVGLPRKELSVQPSAISRQLN